MFFHPTRNTKVLTTRRQKEHFVLKVADFHNEDIYEAFQSCHSLIFHEISISVLQKQKKVDSEKVFNISFFNQSEERIVKLIQVVSPILSCNLNHFSDVLFHSLKMSNVMHVLVSQERSASKSSMAIILELEDFIFK